MDKKIRVAFNCILHKRDDYTIFPLGMAYIAAYAEHYLKDQIESKLFRDPENFFEYYVAERPQIVCFSNYIWNQNLSHEVARRIKALDPNCIVIFGGPNYPDSEMSMQKLYLENHPEIDFYISRDGEEAFVKLFQCLKANRFVLEKTKNLDNPIPSCHYILGKDMIRGDILPGIRPLDQIPSPYLTGLLDSFMEDENAKNALVMLQTVRGCPFKCSFCQEGDDYFNKVRRFSKERVKEELKYISVRTKSENLTLADSNFGMYPFDIKNTCKEIARLQKTMGWPKYVSGIQGKNNKKRLIEAVKMLDGVKMFSAAIQSTSPEVLDNVKRSNISLEETISVAKEGEKIGVMTFGEIILCLPGDTLESHTKSLFDLIDANVQVVRSHQLMLIPGSDISTEANRRNYNMVGRYRVVPNTVFEYQLGEEKTIPYEIDEICVETNTMSFEDYVECRMLNLSVEIFYNDGVFQEVINYLSFRGIKPSSFISSVHLKAIDDQSPIKHIYDLFVNETKNLYKNVEDLKNDMKNPKIIAKYQSDDLGFNEQLKCRAIALLSFMDELNKIAFAQATELLSTLPKFSEEELERDILFLGELIKLSKLRKCDLLKMEKLEPVTFYFDFLSLSNDVYEGDPFKYFVETGVDYYFFPNDIAKSNLLSCSHIKDENEKLMDFMRKFTSLNHLFKEFSTPKEGRVGFEGHIE